MSDRWSHALLALLLLAHFVLLSNQTESEGSPLERWLLAAFAPVGRVTGATVDGVTGLGDAFESAGALRRENRRLEDELAAARHSLVRLQSLEEELASLRRHVEYTRAASVDSYVADVVYVDGVSWLRTLVIHTGREAPVRNQPVMADQGLVGRIVVTAGSYAKVQLITDRSASASAMVWRTRRQGLLQGRGRGSLRLSDVPNQSDVQTGDRVVTAGLDGIYPRGLQIGVVRSALTTPELFQRIEVNPSVDFGLLDRVYVLTDDPLPERVRDDLLGDSPPRPRPADDGGPEPQTDTAASGPQDADGPQEGGAAAPEEGEGDGGGA
ncbi:MAG: rod shape-determining protein MreC [Acidobacteriota bacterium]